MDTARWIYQQQQVIIFAVIFIQTCFSFLFLFFFLKASEFGIWHTFKKSADSQIQINNVSIFTWKQVAQNSNPHAALSNARQWRDSSLSHMGRHAQGLVRKPTQTRACTHTRAAGELRKHSCASLAAWCNANYYIFYPIIIFIYSFISWMSVSYRC